MWQAPRPITLQSSMQFGGNGTRLVMQYPSWQFGITLVVALQFKTAYGVLALPRGWQMVSANDTHIQAYKKMAWWEWLLPRPMLTWTLPTVVRGVLAAYRHVDHVALKR